MGFEETFPAWMAGTKLVIDPAAVPRCLDHPICSGVLWQGAADAFLMEIPGAAHVLVTSGGFALSLQPDAVLSHVAPVLRRTPLAAWCWLNGYYACQGVALAGPDGAVAILGAAGVGKSTLAALLMRQGFRLLCDDLVPFSWAGDGSLQVMPVWPELVLWPGGEDDLPSWLVRRRENPFDVPYYTVAPERFEAAPVALARVYHLQHVQKCAEMEEKITSGLDGFVAGKGGLVPYHRVVAYALRTQGLALRFYGAVVNRAPIKVFTLPMVDISELDAVAAKIESDCGEGSHG